MGKVIFITGTDTGVGKTVLTCLLTRHLRAKGVHVRAVKPFCSGGRDDARALRRAQDNELTLDEINPWHFRAPLTPMLAARKDGREITLAEVIAWLKGVRSESEILLVEGAGGLLSPLGENYDARELITALRAQPLVVCPNRLGAIHQVRAVFQALPKTASRQSLALLRGTGHLNPASRTNVAVLGELLGRDRVLKFPMVSKAGNLPPAATATLEAIRLRTCK